MRSLRRLGSLLLLSCALSACAATQPAPSAPLAPNASEPVTAPHAVTPQGGPWQLPHDAGDPRLGQLRGAHGALDEAQLLARAMAADVVYLGEVHDNPDHHRLQVHVVAQLLARGAKPALVLEAVREDQQPQLDRLARGGEAEAQRAEDYRVALAWERSGWPDFAMYAPLFELAIRHDLQLIAGDVPRERIKRVAFGEALEPAGARRLGLDRPLPEAQQTALEAQLKDSHCGLLPERALPAMAAAQRLRDASLAWHARSQPKPAQGPRSVVFTGNGHARSDRGAPAVWHDDASRRTLSVGLLELPDEGELPAQELAPFDVVWLTPRATRDDPCAKMRESHATR